jgi:glycosyltransferase involved in cell wall biosynthesis
MKILHLCLSCFYIDNYNYQENELPRINKEHGHDVEIIASTETFIKNKKLGYIEPSTYINGDGIQVIRIPYSKLFPRFVIKKLRSYKGVYKLIDKFKPDVILFHGTAAFEIINVAKYVKNNPNVKLYVDSHSDINNSGTSWLSLNILHKIFYRWCNKVALKSINKIFYLSEETKDFLLDIYKTPKDLLEFYPIGGIIFSDEERLEKRSEKRKELKLSDEDILLVHSGKMDKFKRTEDIIKAFSKVNSKYLKLVIIGSFTDDVNNVVEPLINENDNIYYLGWKDMKELSKYLCASDLYVQPGSQSATMQNAICCGSPIALYPHKSYIPFVRDNGYFVETIDDMVEVFTDINLHPEKIKIMSNNSLKFAREVLNYQKLASRLYN